MNTLGKTPIAENGRITNDRVIILDAGAQYGKVNHKLRLEIGLISLFFKL